MERTDNIENMVTVALKSVMNGKYTDITRVYLYCYCIESVLVSLLNAKRLGMLESYDEHCCSNALVQMKSLELLSDDVFAFWEQYKSIVHSNCHFDELAAYNPLTIHECFLSRELYFSENDVKFVPGKVFRDTTGSYYTPNDLAIEVVHEAVEKYLQINSADSISDAAYLLSTAKFADLSCGCGEFLNAVITFLLEKYSIRPEIACMNLYGIDIDPIALQIAICGLLNKVEDRSKWNTIIGHFTLGNPLISQPNEKSVNIKTRLFAIKRYYSPDMGINISELHNTLRFDVIVGNPPWEKIRFEERKFFRPIMPEISDTSQKNKRRVLINRLKTLAPDCYDWYMQVSDDYGKFRNTADEHPYINKSISGELNTYALFSELSLNMLSNTGVMSLITKSSVVTSPANKQLFAYLSDGKCLASICLYSNAKRIFSIDSREQFCILTCTGSQNETFELVAGAAEVSDFHQLERIRLSTEDVSCINPNTKMLPSITKNNDIETLLDIHKRLPLFKDVYPNCHFGRLVHLTAHSENIDTLKTDMNLPIYEGKFIERYDARFTTFSGLSDAQKYAGKAHARKCKTVDSKKELPESRYFIHKDYWDKLSAAYTEPYMLCWRSLTSPTNARTTLAMILPKMPTCQSIQFLQIANKIDLLIILALFDSKPFDYFVRLKMPGIDLTQNVIKQIPVPQRKVYQHQVSYSGISQPLEKHILARVTDILAEEPIVLPLLREMGVSIKVKQEISKSVLEKEIDDLFFIAYGLSELETKTINLSFKK